MARKGKIVYESTLIGTQGGLNVNSQSHSYHVLFEDNHCLVVAKPSRLLTASDKTGDETLLAMVRAYQSAKQAPGKKGYLVPIHFLDRPVSGVVIFACSSKGAERLNEQFRSRKIRKTYLAIVEGRPPQESGELVDFLLKDRDSNITSRVKASTPGAKECRLFYKTLTQKNGLSLLQVNPVTGRSHQIRVQLSGQGWPIYGDVKYGASQTWDNMIALHALAVTFNHPTLKTPITVQTPVPAEWEDLWPNVSSHIGNLS